MNSCIFCLEGGELLHNVKCRCNYCFHQPCYDSYDKKTICPLCRATVGELFTPEHVVIEIAPVQIPVEEPTEVAQLGLPIVRSIMLCIIFVLLLIMFIILIKFHYG
jgi:hypothetical protein